eukprot:TRINITY_DN3167_c0_g3_i1.p1 TRINITY_DN3167_c0_g3~~TRINITY_DN3167_c0_g3_i1.p1  ORF type:complete len:910 (+),score=115.97 TRINITY_DN3167_c0_g3_i1:654-3383(+)
MAGMADQAILQYLQHGKTMVDSCAIGTPGSLSYRVMFTSDSSSLLSPWHDIPLCSPRVGFSCICTTPAGSWVKYCLADEPLDPLRVQKENCPSTLRKISSLVQSTQSDTDLSSSPHSVPAFALQRSDSSKTTPPSALTSPFLRTGPTGSTESPSAFGVTGGALTASAYQLSTSSSAFGIVSATNTTSAYHSNTSPVDNYSSVNSPYGHNSLSRNSGGSSSTFSSFSASFSEDDLERSHRESDDMIAFDVIGRPAHFTENSAWHCGFLPQTSVAPHTFSSRTPADGTNHQAQHSPLETQSLEVQSTQEIMLSTTIIQSPDAKCQQKASSPDSGDSSQASEQDPRPLHPTIKIPVVDRSPSLDSSAGRDLNLPLDVMEIGSCKERCPGDVYEVKPLASFVWRPNGGPEVPLAVVVVALDNPMEPLLEDGEDVEALVPGMLEKMRLWLQTQQRLNSEATKGVLPSSPVRLETSIMWTTAAISKSHLAWQSQYELAILQTPPFSLPSLDKSMLTCLWDTYTRGSSSYLSHVAIPFSQPKTSTKGDSEERCLRYSLSFKEASGRSSEDAPHVANRRASTGHISRSTIPLSQITKCPSKGKGNPGQLRRSLTQRRSESQDDNVSEVNSHATTHHIAHGNVTFQAPDSNQASRETYQSRKLLTSKSCRERRVRMPEVSVNEVLPAGRKGNAVLSRHLPATHHSPPHLSPPHHSPFSLSTLKSYLPHASWLKKGKHVEFSMGDEPALKDADSAPHHPTTSLVSPTSDRKVTTAASTSPHFPLVPLVSPKRDGKIVKGASTAPHSPLVPSGSPMGGTKIARGASTAPQSPTVLSGNTTPKRLSRRSSLEGIRPKTGFFVAKSTPELGAEAKVEAEGEGRKTHSRRKSSSEFDFVSKVKWADIEFGIETEDKKAANQLV